MFLKSGEQTHPSLESVLEATRGPLGELDVDLLVSAPPPSTELGAMVKGAQSLAQTTHAIAVVWLATNLRADGEVLVYFYDPVRAKLLTRSVAVSESETAAAEEVAVVLRSALGALLAGADVAMTEVRVPEPVESAPPRPAPAPEQNTASARRESAHAGVALSYVGTIMARELSLQIGARLSAGFQPSGSRWVLTAAYEFFPPWRVERDRVSTRLYRHPAELSLARQLLGPTLCIAPEVALMADPLLRRTERAESPLVATPDSTRWLWALSTRVRARWALHEGFSLVGALGADIVLNPFNQVTEGAVQSAPVYSLLRVRPVVDAGLQVDIW